MHCRRCSGASTRTAATAFAFAFAFLVSFSSATATATANACSAESDCYPGNPEGAETHEEESEEEEWGWADIEYCINEDCADQKTNCFGDAQCKQLFNAVASREDGADGEPRYPTDVELGQSELLDGLFRCYAAKCDNEDEWDEEDASDEEELVEVLRPTTPVPVLGARLTRTPSGMLFATTRGRGFEKLFELAASAVLRWAEAEGIAVKAKLQQKLAHVAITYIMTTSGEKRDTGMFLDLASTPEFDAVTAMARVLPKRMTDYIDNKRSYGRLARQAGVEGTDSAVPRTFDSTADAIKVLGSDPAGSKYVFIKDVHGAGGSGVTVRRTADLKDVELGPHQIIQAGVTKFALVEGRKFKIRTYVIAYRGKLYLSRHWHGYKGSSLYNPDSADEDLDGQHVSQLFLHKESKVAYWEKNGGAYLIAEDAPLRKEWTAGIAAAATLMLPMFDKIVSATADDPYRYHIFGLDAVPREDHSVQIVECNPFPNLVTQQAPLARANLIDGGCTATRMLASVLRLLFGMEAGVPDDLIELMA